MSAYWPDSDGYVPDGSPSQRDPDTQKKLEQIIADAPVIVKDDPDEKRRLTEEIQKEFRRQKTD